MANQYPGKLLFFGEYTIINGSLALALPYPYFNGQWNSEKKVDQVDAFHSSRAALKELLSYLEKQEFQSLLELESFKKDLDAGYWFESDIPNGYGCGSSGAVCAGIYDRYAIKKAKDIPQLQKKLAAIEGFFHGQSSGVDPLVCYLKEAMLIKDDGPVVVDASNCFDGSLKFFLIDTGIARKTTPFVQHYKEQAQEVSFHKACIEPLKGLNRKAIDQFLRGDVGLHDSWKAISVLEFEYFQFMIPEGFKDVWDLGTKNASYSLKLCGAGGGGYILGASSDWGRSQEELKDYVLIGL